MPPSDNTTPLPLLETLERLNVDDLKALVRLLDRQPPTRKTELVQTLKHLLVRDVTLQRLYQELDDIGKAAVQEATYDPEGTLRHTVFIAKYGEAPQFNRITEPYGYEEHRHPTKLRLFFPERYRAILPSDMRTVLQTFIPPPRPLTVATGDELPSTIDLHGQSVALQVREMAGNALLDVRAVLLLADKGGIRISDKTQRPSEATSRAVAAVLRDGEFYAPGQCPSDDWDAVQDLAITGFAWPMLLQAAGLAQPFGGILKLTPMGRKALDMRAADVIRAVWDKWQESTLLDELGRVSTIKGQQARNTRLTPVASRRRAIVGALRELPIGKWIMIDEFFRTIHASKHSFAVTKSPWDLYIQEREYGSLGYADWTISTGRYTLAFLFEYAATLGLVDVAYICPHGARSDFHDQWGTDEMSCLSRYDGLKYIRLTPLGAWCLGRTPKYEPEPQTIRPIFQVLANSDVVSTSQPPAADMLLLETFAEQTSESVWRLQPARILSAVEQGRPVSELRRFLTAQGTLPQTVEVLLDDLERRAGLLRDRGTVRMIECADVTTAQLLVHDRRLSRFCHLAGERQLVFRAEEETAVRRALKELGYVLPPPTLPGGGS